MIPMGMPEMKGVIKEFDIIKVSPNAIIANKLRAKIKQKKLSGGSPEDKKEIHREAEELRFIIFW